MSKKFIAAAVVAIFCITAFASVAGESDAAKEKDYILYIEEQTIVLDVPMITYGYVYFSAEANAESYVKAANAALAKSEFSELSCEVSEGYLFFKHTDTYNIGTWNSDGMAWTMSDGTPESYFNNAKTAVEVNGYISTEQYDALDEVYRGMYFDTETPGDWQYLLMPSTSAKVGDMKDYIVYLTFINDKYVATETVVLLFSAEQDPIAWCYGINETVRKLGNSTFANFEANYNEVKGSIWIDFTGVQASYYKEAGKWAQVSDTAKDYTGGNEVDFELNHGYIDEDAFNTLSEKEKKNWTDTGWGGDYAYIRNATGEVVEDAISLVLIIGIVGVLILAIIIAIVLIMVVRKKSGNKTA